LCINGGVARHLACTQKGLVRRWQRKEVAKCYRGTVVKKKSFYAAVVKRACRGLLAFKISLRCGDTRGWGKQIGSATRAKFQWDTSC